MNKFVFFVGIGPAFRRVRCDDRMEFCAGGGIVAMIFGLPFLGAGLMLVWGLLFRGAPKILQTHFQLSELPFLVVVLISFVVGAAVFSVAGAISVFSRSGTIINKQTGTLTQWWRLLWIRRSTVFALADFSNVVTQPTKSGFLSGPRSAVLLVGPDKTATIVSGPPGKRIVRAADEIAAFLGLPNGQPSAFTARQT